MSYRALQAGLQQPRSTGGTSSGTGGTVNTTSSGFEVALVLSLHSTAFHGNKAVMRSYSWLQSLSGRCTIRGERTWTRLLSTIWAEINMKSTLILMLGLPGDLTLLL